jgi:uncharacterized protein YciI
MSPPPLTVVLGTYLAELDEIDAHRPAHLEWIDEQIAAGRILVAGRRTPPDGSVLVLVDIDAEAAHALMEQDPHALKGLVRYDVAGVFTPSRLAPRLAELLA